MAHIGCLFYQVGANFALLKGGDALAIRMLTEMAPQALAPMDTPMGVMTMPAAPVSMFCGLR